MVKHWYGILEGRFSARLVAGFDCRKYLFDASTHHGTLAGVTITTLNGLTDSFARLRRIGQCIIPLEFLEVELSC